MDFITQGIAGALLAQTSAKKAHKGVATLAGFLAGLLSSADILIRSGNDPLLSLEFQHQFSYSLLFIPIGGLIAAAILWPFMRKYLSFGYLAIFCVLGYSSSGLLSAITSVGTEIFWPFSDERIAWNLVSRIDPVLTTGLLVTLIIGWKKQQTRFAFMGISFAAMYLFLAYTQQQVVVVTQQQLAQARGHQIEQSVVKPTMGNIILWRSVYLHRGRYYSDAIRQPFFGQMKIYTGSSIEKYRTDPRLNDLAEVVTKYRDLQRFNTLSQGFLVKHPQDSNVISDIRTASLPHSAIPLSGIRMDTENTHEHVSEVHFEKNKLDVRKTFFRMLRGVDAGG